MLEINNSYLNLPKQFYQIVNPTTAKNPKIAVINEDLSSFLKINIKDREKFLEIFSGKKILPKSVPIALVYAGHQFGHFVPQLGDGRAILLGDITGSNNKLFDIQLKGSGITKFSRNGDGKCPLGPALREFIMSEALHFLNVPTTRSLAVILTGEDVFREKRYPGAILVRVASSHLRVGTFEYFYAKKDIRNLQNLFDFCINRHFKELNKLPNEEKCSEFLLNVMKRHINLVTKWLSFGFIHGVMNTDNTTISGETIDYGPCAFVDNFSKNRVFSSIDYRGRYSFFNQPRIALWNLNSLANCLTLLLESKASKRKLEDILSAFSEKFNSELLKIFCNKIGLFEKKLFNEKLIQKWLDILEENNLDFNNSFLRLSESVLKKKFLKNFPNSELSLSFFEEWSQAINKQRLNKIEIKEKLGKINPQYIARNHLVDQAINHALDGDYSKFHNLHNVLKAPFNFSKQNKIYQKPQKNNTTPYQTFCGT